MKTYNDGYVLGRKDNTDGKSFGQPFSLCNHEARIGYYDGYHNSPPSTYQMGYQQGQIDGEAGEHKVYVASTDWLKGYTNAFAKFFQTQRCKEIKETMESELSINPKSYLQTLVDDLTKEGLTEDGSDLVITIKDAYPTIIVQQFPDSFETKVWMHCEDGLEHIKTYE